MFYSLSFSTRAMCGLENFAWCLLALLTDEVCLCPEFHSMLAEWKWHVGDLQGLVKLRCRKINAVKDGVGQQNSAKPITSHCLLSIVLNQWNIPHLTGNTRNSSFILCFAASFGIQIYLLLLLDGITALGLTEKFSVHLKVNLQHVTALKDKVYECHN